MGVAVAFDFVGGDMKKLCFSATGFDGRVISTVEEPLEFDLNIWRADVSPLFAKSGTYHFVALSARARNGRSDDWSIYRDMMASLARLVSTGKISMPKVTNLGELTEKNIRKAHNLLQSGHIKGKLIMTIGE